MLDALKPAVRACQIILKEELKELLRLSKFADSLWKRNARNCDLGVQGTAHTCRAELSLAEASWGKDMILVW